MGKKLNNRTKGFTLIELLVTMGIFSIIVGAIVGLFIFGVQQQRRSLITRAILDQTSYALEYMSRALRMAKKELDAPDCLSQDGLNYEIPTTPIDYRIGGNPNLGTGIRFINHLQGDDCQEFFLENNQLKQWSQNRGNTLPLTSTPTGIKINLLKINLIGASQGPPGLPEVLQPKVTIFLELEGGITGESQKIKIQTTISQRNLDVQYEE